MDQTGPLGFVLWRTISDVLLWTSSTPAERGSLFRAPGTGRDESMAYATLDAPEIRGPLQVLRTVTVVPDLADEAALAEACAAIAAWAERQGMGETSLQFAEAAARLESEVSSRSYTAGRLCRRMGDHARSAIWYRRAARLARRAHQAGIKGSEIDFANAHLGLGNLELDLGHFEQAERHYWKAIRAALRSGRKSLAAAGHHNLLALMIAARRIPKAQEHAREAALLYTAGHPRFHGLAHDVAFLWLWQGHFSSALPILEKVLPWFAGGQDRIAVLASIARCAAAVRDHIRYQRTASNVLAMAAADAELADSSLYHLAEGARSFWDWERAEKLALRARELARQRGNTPVIELTDALLAAVAEHQPGDVDIVPEEGGSVDVTREMILAKLQKLPAPEPSSGAVPPERYPTE